MGKLKRIFGPDLAVMKRELSTEREAANEKLVKKIKLEKVPSFRKKGHESISVTTRRCGLSFRRPAPPWMNSLQQWKRPSNCWRKVRS